MEQCFLGVHGYLLFRCCIGRRLGRVLEGECVLVQLMSLQGLDGLLGMLLEFEFNKTKAHREHGTGVIGVFLGRDLHTPESKAR